MIWGKRRSKYNAVKTKTGGITYDSKFEAKKANDLAFALLAGQLKDIERQVKIELHAYGVHICDYYIDFKVTHTNNQIEYIEAKGKETPEFKIKWKMFVAKMAIEEPDAILTIAKK